MKRTHFVLLVSIVFLAFGTAYWFLTTADPYFLVPIHLSLGGVLLIGALLSRGGRQLFTPSARRNLQFGAGVTVYSSLFVAVLAVANIIGAVFPIFRYDSTDEQVFSLAPETLSLIEELKEPLKIRAFYFGGKIEDRRVEALLRRLAESSPQISLEVIDPEKRPTLLERFQVQQSATVVLSPPEEKNSVKVVSAIDEERIANALKKLLRQESRKVYYLLGHGEPEISNRGPLGYSLLADAIDGERITLVPLVLGAGADVPSDCSSLIVAAPRKELLPAERASLERYLQRGGNAVFLHEVTASNDIPELVRPLGIEISRDVVIDKSARAGDSSEMGVEPMVSEFGDHPVTSQFHQAIIFSTASSIKISPERGADESVTALARSSGESWGETDTATLFSDDPRVSLDSADLKGPLPMAVAYEKQGSGRVVVFGDADFVSNRSIRQLFNRDFFLNALNWTTGEGQGITIRPRVLKASAVNFTPSQLGLMFLLSTIVLPEAVVLSGLTVWARRKGVL